MSGRPLARRVATAAIGGALVTAAIGALLAVPLIRSVARDQARAELARTVETLAASPRISAQLLARERTTVGPDDRRYALIGSTQAGDALDFLTAADTATLQRTGTLSTSHRVDGELFLIEGRAITKGGLGRRGDDVVAAQPVSNVGAATGALVRRLALALLLGLLAATGLAALLARRVARPVREAAARAHRLAAGERALPPPAPTSVTEIDEMSEALGALDAALATSEGRQREFLLSISHELRTPLTALQGYAEALRDGAIGADEVGEVGRVLVAETTRLDRFIADLLALARLEADDFRLELTEVDVRRLVGDAVEAWQATARGAGIRLSATVTDDPVVTGDPMRLRQLLDGLIENALRATPGEGSVVVGAEAAAGGVTLSVTDDGAGLSAEEYENAFTRGYLRDRYAAERGVGTGLGLSIAHRLAERMGARIEAGPAQPRGTAMRVHLGEAGRQA
jgi:two-component system OmpR family sensor kinase